DGVEAIPSFIKALDSGFDFIQGSRFIKGGYHKNTPFIRLLGMKLFTFPVMRLFGVQFTDVHNGFKGLSKSFLLHPQLVPFRNIFSGYSLLFYFNFAAAKLKAKTLEIPVKRVYPNSGILPTKCKGIKMHLAIICDILKTVFGVLGPQKI
ncbi:MAG: glycosyltransferase family 2 protein, partial [Candidatus Omnitrophica bacterium]|nr:glycosyltransferase family 2 protein [Candidatus Omnitrophota bacterium]